MGHAVAATDASRSIALLRLARIALSVAAGAALGRIGLALGSTPASGPDFPLLGLYGAIALSAIALQWGVQSRSGLARWGTVLAGLVMTAVLVAGRAEFVLFWQHLPLPPVYLLLFAGRLLILVGFVVAGLCCVVAKFEDAPRW